MPSSAARKARRANAPRAGNPASSRREDKKGKKKTPHNPNLISAAHLRVTEVIEPAMPLFAAKTQRRLRYSDYCSLTSTSGVVTSYVLAVNGAYDPDITGTGHQPKGFDSMMLFYNHYCVMDCALHVTCQGYSSSKMTVCLRMDASSTPLTSINDIIEQGGCVIDYLDVTATHGSIAPLGMVFNIPKIQGVSKSAMTADTSLRGTSVSNPTELTYAHLQVWDAAGQTGQVVFNFVMDWNIVFLEPRDAPQSLAERLRQEAVLAAKANKAAEIRYQWVDVPPELEGKGYERVLQVREAETRGASPDFVSDLLNPQLDARYFSEKYRISTASVPAWKAFAMEEKSMLKHGASLV